MDAIARAHQERRAASRSRSCQGCERSSPVFRASRAAISSSRPTAGRRSAAFPRPRSTLDAAITELNGGKPIPPWRMHDLRRTMATGMARLGVQLPVVEKILNHICGIVWRRTGHLSAPRFADEKRDALERWASTCWSLRHEARLEDALAPHGQRDRSARLIALWSGRKGAIHRLTICPSFTALGWLRPARTS